ncbi:hypothetical protein NQ318_013364, partial [Aromia moschata]
NWTATYLDKITPYTTKYLKDYLSGAIKDCQDITVIQRLSVKCGTGACPTARNSVSCVQTARYSTNTRVCDWWFNVDCASTPNYYGINEDLYRVPAYSNQQNPDHN